MATFKKLLAKRTRSLGTGAFADNPKGTSKNKIYIGIVDSGGTGEEDQYYFNSRRLAIANINGVDLNVHDRKWKKAAEGIIKGKFIEPVETSYPPISLTEFVKRHNLLALIGPIRSTQVQMISSEVKNIGIPTAIGGTNVTLTQQGNPWLFRCRPNDQIVANAMVEYIRKEMKIKKVGILHDSDIFGTGGADLVEQDCISKGVTVIKRENYDAGNKNYHAKLESIKNAGAQVIVVYGTNPEDVALIQLQYRDLGFPYQYIGSPSSGMRACLQKSREAAEGLTMIADYVPGREATQKYADAYKREYKNIDELDSMKNSDPENYYRLLHSEEMDPTAAWYYDALHILALGIKNGGEDRNEIMKAILNIKNYEGVLGTYSFTPNGDGLHKVSVVRIENGRHKLIK